MNGENQSSAGRHFLLGFSCFILGIIAGGFFVAPAVFYWLRTTMSEEAALEYELEVFEKSLLQEFVNSQVHYGHLHSSPSGLLQSEGGLFAVRAMELGLDYRDMDRAEVFAFYTLGFLKVNEEGQLLSQRLSGGSWTPLPNENSWAASYLYSPELVKRHLSDVDSDGWYEILAPNRDAIYEIRRGFHLEKHARNKNKKNGTKDR